MASNELGDDSRMGSEVPTTAKQVTSGMTLKRAYLILLFAFIWLIGFSLLGGAVAAPPERRYLADIIFPIAFGGFVIIFLAGFAVWAAAKGYSPLLGVVLAWTGPLGMLILVFLKDKKHDS